MIGLLASRRWLKGINNSTLSVGHVGDNGNYTLIMESYEYQEFVSDEITCMGLKAE